MGSELMGGLELSIPSSLGLSGTVRVTLSEQLAPNGSAPLYP